MYTYITYDILPIMYRGPVDCVLIALDTHMFNDNGYGPGTIGSPQLLVPGAFGLGPYPL